MRQCLVLVAAAVTLSGGILSVGAAAAAADEPSPMFVVAGSPILPGVIYSGAIGNVPGAVIR